MTHQVLIREKGNGKLETILVSLSEIHPSPMIEGKILYQRNFENRQKAEDHKTLLDLLSQESLRMVINEQSKTLSHSDIKKHNKKRKHQLN